LGKRSDLERLASLGGPAGDRLVRIAIEQRGSAFLAEMSGEVDGRNRLPYSALETRSDEDFIGGKFFQTPARPASVRMSGRRAI
jgi:hypothetical protein